MDNGTAVTGLQALAQETRLATLRLLAHAELDGLAAGESAERLNVPRNTMSSHLSVLSRSGIISSERRSRSIIYRAEIALLDKLVVFLSGIRDQGRR